MWKEKKFNLRIREYKIANIENGKSLYNIKICNESSWSCPCFIKNGKVTFGKIYFWCYISYLNLRKNFFVSNYIVDENITSFFSHTSKKIHEFIYRVNDTQKENCFTQFSTRIEGTLMQIKKSANIVVFMRK